MGNTAIEIFEFLFIVGDESSRLNFLLGIHFTSYVLADLIFVT